MSILRDMAPAHPLRRPPDGHVTDDEAIVF